MRKIQGFTPSRRHIVKAAGALAAGIVAPALLRVRSAYAAFPDRPVRIVAAVTPGGPADLIARMVAAALQQSTGKTFIVENRPGGGGNVGMSSAAHSEPDGYTILLATTQYTVNVGFFKQLPFDAEKDFVGVSELATSPNVFVVKSDLPAKTIKEFVALARAKPGVLNFESAGIGSSTHLVGELFKKTFKVNLTHVPFTGGGPGLNAMLSNQVQLGFENLAAMLPYINSGKLRAIAVTGAHRSPLLPDVPTIAESGYPEFTVTGQFGFLVPAGVPRPVIARLNAALDKTMKDPTLVAKLSKLGAEAETSTPEAFDKLIKEESARWLGMIKELGIGAE